DHIKDFVEYNGKRYPVKYAIHRKLNAPENLVANSCNDFDWNLNSPQKLFLSDVDGAPVNLGWCPDIYIPGAKAEKMEGIASMEMFSYNIDKAKGLIEIIPSIDELRVDEVIINGNKLPVANDGIYPYQTKADSNMPEVTINYTLFGKYKMTSNYEGKFNSSLPESNIESGVEEIEAIDVNNPVHIYNLEGKQIYFGLPQGKNLPAGIYILRQGKKASKLVIRN
ncbi:MAG: hypothetical protein K2G90_01015, partial [Muribaculaceae bacterium]|nr:hypothetical protein [Muribaculaceae bacterium]